MCGKWRAWVVMVSWYEHWQCVYMVSIYAFNHQVHDVIPFDIICLKTSSDCWAVKTEQSNGITNLVGMTYALPFLDKPLAFLGVWASPWLCKSPLGSYPALVLQIDVSSTHVDCLQSYCGLDLYYCYVATEVLEEQVFCVLLQAIIEWAYSSLLSWVGNNTTMSCTINEVGIWLSCCLQRRKENNIPCNFQQSLDPFHCLFDDEHCHSFISAKLARWCASLSSDLLSELYYWHAFCMWCRLMSLTSSWDGVASCTIGPVTIVEVNFLQCKHA